VPHNLCCVSMSAKSLFFFDDAVSKTLKFEYSCKINNVTEISKKL